NLERLDLVHPAFAAAFAAWLLDHLAAAMAVRARSFDHEQALLRADLAVTFAQFAAAPRGARRRPRAGARLAGDRNLDLYFGGFAVERILELDLQIVAQVGTPARATASRPAAAECAAEDRFENVAEIAEVGLLRSAAHSLLE